MASPIILYDNRFNDGTPVATDTASGYDVLNIKDLRTYTFWKAASVGTKYITVDCGAVDKYADCLCMIGHNLKDANATVSVESSNDNFVSNTTVRLAGFTPTNNKASMKLFTLANDRYWRIKIMTTYVIPQIAVIMLGQKLQFPFPPESPYPPYRESVKMESSRSKQGHLLGSTIRYKPLKISPKFSNTTRTWMFEGAGSEYGWGDFPWGDTPWGGQISEINFMAFWDYYASDRKPYFYCGDIDVFPQHVFFCRVPDDYEFELPMSILQFIDSLNLEMEAIKEV